MARRPIDRDSREIARKRFSEIQTARIADSKAKVDAQSDQSRVEKELERLERSKQQKKIPRGRQSQKQLTEFSKFSDWGSSPAERNKRLDQLQRQHKERRLDAQRAQEQKAPVAPENQQSREIRSKVKRAVLRSLASEPDPLLGLTAVDLAFASVALSSAQGERRNAIELARGFEGIEDILGILRGNLIKSLDSDRRKDNIVYALTALGRSEEAKEIISGKHDFNVPSTLEQADILDWAILPPGWWDDSKYTDHISKDPKTAQLFLERLRYVDQLNPLERWRSQERLGSDPYWVFVFPHHVVAECPTHGNAIYIIKGTSDWRNLLNRSKADLLAGFPGRVVRIMHSGEWQSRLRRKLQEKW